MRSELLFSQPDFWPRGVLTRWAPQELDSVNDGQASPSPPLARACVWGAAKVAKTTAQQVKKTRIIVPR